MFVVKDERNFVIWGIEVFDDIVLDKKKLKEVLLKEDIKEEKDERK